MRWFMVVLFVSIVAGIASVPYGKIYDDGLWDLSVNVRSAAGQPIKGISAEGFLSVDQARQMLADLPPLELTRAESSLYSAVQAPKLEQPIEVKIPTSETSYRSLLWTQRRFFQYRGLLVVVEYDDGKLEGRAVEIPDLRQARQLTVEVP